MAIIYVYHAVCDCPHPHSHSIRDIYVYICVYAYIGRGVCYLSTLVMQLPVIVVGHICVGK